MSESPRSPRKMEDLHPIERAMTVYAHPDDAEFSCSGTIAKLADEGVEVTVVVCTAGNRGGEGDRSEAELAAVRDEEQKEANRILGITSYVNLGYDDGSLLPSLELRKDITRVIRHYRPNVVICGNPVRNLRSVGGSHPDHLAAGEATMAAIYPTARNPMALPELLAEGLEKWVVDWTWVTGSSLEEPNHYVDIAGTVERKADALAAHKSQLGDWVREYAHTSSADSAKRAATAGIEGLEYAEEFFRIFSGEANTREAADFAEAQRHPEGSA